MAPCLGGLSGGACRSTSTPTSTAPTPRSPAPPPPTAALPAPPRASSSAPTRPPWPVSPPSAATASTTPPSAAARTIATPLTAGQGQAAIRQSLLRPAACITTDRPCAIPSSLSYCCWSPPRCAPSRTIFDACLNRALSCATSSRTSAPQQAESERPTITIDGQTLRVERTVDDLGQALYLSLQHQWQRRCVSTSTSNCLGMIPCCATMRGSAARVAGNHRRAAKEYEALLAAQPDFLPARLELARVYAEDQRDRDAVALFTAIAAGINADDPATAGVRARGRLPGALHASAGKARCPPARHGVTTSTAARPAAPACSAWATPASSNAARRPARARSDYDASLERRWVLSGHHGLYVRGLAFGQTWRGHSAYNELNANVQVGYSWRSARQTVLLAPAMTTRAWVTRRCRAAVACTRNGARSLLKLEADWKRQRYRQQGLASNYDGELASAYATWFRALNPRWTVFAGLDVTGSSAADPANGYRQHGLRLGRRASGRAPPPPYSCRCATATTTPGVRCWRRAGRTTNRT